MITIDKRRRKSEMKKIKLGLLTLSIILGVILAGCNSDSNQSTSSPNKIKKESQTVKNTQYYFTANEGGSISKIDSSTNKVVKTINVDGAVHNVQVSPDGKMIGATVVPSMNHNEDSHDEGTMEMKGKVLFFDTATSKLINSVEVGNHPAHIVFTEDGKRVLVTNNEDNNVSVIDTDTFTVTNTIKTGQGPHGFRISSDSQKAYIANMGEDTISVLNLSTLKGEKKIKVGSTPVTTGITSDGKILVATLNAEDSLAIVNLSNNQVKKVKVGNGPAQVYIDASNRYAYVANQGTEEAPSHSVTMVDLKSNTAIATIETGNGSHGVVTSSDGKRLYVTNMFENTVSVIDTKSKKVIDTIKVGKTPNGISIMK